MLRMEIVRYDSAGGIVFDGDRLLLLRKSALGEVVLPKGHIEPGETAEGAALRETVEETGYTKLEVLADLGTLQAQFPFKGDWYIRSEHYFVMRLIDRERGHVDDYDDAEHDRLRREVLGLQRRRLELDRAVAEASLLARRRITQVTSRDSQEVTHGH